MKLDYSKICDIELDGIDTRDYPDFCDAFIASANYEYAPGEFRELTEDELQALNEDFGYVYDLVWNHLF